MEAAEEKVEEALRLDHPAHHHGGIPSVTVNMESPRQDAHAANRDSEYTLTEVDIEKAEHGSSASLSSDNDLDNDLEPSATRDKIIISFADDDPENPYAWGPVGGSF